MHTVEPAEGAVLQQVLDTAYPLTHQGLSRQAFATYDAALKKTAWALGHRQAFALVDARMHVLASAQRYQLTGTLDHRRVDICGIGAVAGDPADDGRHVWELIEQLVGEAGTAGAEVALISVRSHERSHIPDGFEAIPTMEAELRVTESPRRGAPMTLVRGGEDRDLAAIVAMGEVRALPYRFHLDRDFDFVKHAITRNRLLAGLSSAGTRQLQFVIAEEGITAAAYAVISIVDHTWTIEECGDRDASGARVGAILQALIAREPAERRPLIRAWLPPGFVPPQVTIVSERPSEEVLMIRALSPTIAPPRLSSDEALYWRSDIL